MEIKEIAANYLPKIREHILPLGLGFVGLILLSFGLIHSISSGRSSDQDIIFESSDSSSAKERKEIVVDIQGAVVSAGVYSLNSDARIKDALISASGLSSDADREWVAKNLNQAAKLTDGAKIYIPSRGEVSLRETNSVGVISASGLVNINSGSSSELESLPGIGPVTAGKIIDNRPYSAIEELRSKKVVGQNVFEKIKDKISTY